MTGRIAVLTPRNMLGGYLEGSSDWLVADGEKITIEGFHYFDAETLTYRKELQVFAYDEARRALIPVPAE